MQSWLRGHLYLVAYLILVAVIVVALYRTDSLADENRARIRDDEKTLALLCNRGWVEMDVVAAAQALVEARLTHDEVAGDQQSILADRTFLDQMTRDSWMFYSQLTDVAARCPGRQRS